MRDSAGVAIAESGALPERGAGGWVLEQRPSLAIGTLDGDTLYQLYSINGGARLSDGRIVLSDAGSFQVRIFSGEGEALGQFGREGEGPGEFLSVRLVGVLPPDTLVVVDGRQRRISLLHPDGGFLGQSTVVEAAGHTLVTNGMFQDGSVVLGGELSFGPGGGVPVQGINRGDTPYRSVARDGTLAASFGSIPGPEIFVQTQGGGGEFHVSASMVPFGRSPVAHARGDRLFLGSSDTWEISAFDPRGNLAGIVRVLQPPPPATPRDLDRFIEARVAELADPSLGPALRSSFRDMPTPETMPAYQSVTVDSEGCLWVEDFQRPGERLRTWTVFDREGVPLTRLSLPDDNRVLEIGADYVLAVFQDPLGVEYLHLYDLARGG